MAPPTKQLTPWLATVLHAVLTRGAAGRTSPGASAPAAGLAASAPPPPPTPDPAPLAGARIDLAQLPLPDTPTIALAVRNGAAALLWSALHQAQRLEALAPQARALLRAARDREAALGLESAAAAQRLTDALLADEIPVIALKGLALRSALYGPLGLTRAPGDIDLMVPPKHLHTARTLMVGQGYVPWGGRVAERYDRHQHIEPYTLPHSPSVIVDMHWTPLHPRSPYRIDVERWWQQAVPLDGSATGLLRLGDLDLALHYALQIDFADAYAGKGRGLFDLAAWMLHRGIHPSALHERACAGGATGAVPRIAATLDRTYGTAFARALGVAATPAGIVGRAWRRAVDASLWLPVREGRIPLWYIHYCSRALGRAPHPPAACWAVLKPVFANPRLGGKGFQAYPGESGEHAGR